MIDYNKIITRSVACVLAFMLTVGMLFGTAATFSADDSETNAVVIEADDRTFAQGEKCNLLWGVSAVSSDGASLLKDLTVTVNGSATDIERTFDEGIYTVNYAVEHEGNTYEKSVTFTVTANKYIDITTPVIFGTRDLRVLTGATVDLLEGVTAVDELDGDVTKLIQVTVNGSKAQNGSYKFTDKGEYTLVYTVADSAGNSNSCEAHVTVSDEAYDRAFVENAVGTTDRHDLTTATVISKETSILYSGKTGNGNKTNKEAVKITHSADTHAFTYFYLGETFDDYTDPTLEKGIEFYIYYSNSGSKAVNISLSGGAERRSIRINTANYQTSMGDGWYKVSMPFADFCSSDSMLASTGEVNAITFQLACSSNNDYFIIDELTLTQCKAAVASPVITPTDNGISWNAIENAGKYEIYNNGKLLDTVKTLNYSLSNQPSGFYHLTVVAVPSDSDEYYSSRHSNEISCVNIIAGQTVALEAPVIWRDYYTVRWELSGYASGYTLYADGKALKSVDATVNSIDLSEIIADTKPHEITVVANGDGDPFTDSAPSDALIYSNVSADTEASDLASKLASDYGIDTLDTANFEYVSENSLYGTVATGSVTGTAKYSGLKYSFDTVDDFSEAVVTIDVKFVSNCNNLSFKIKPTPDGGRSSEYQVSVGKNGADGIKVTALSNGYYRYVINCGEAFSKKGGCESVSSFMIVFSNSDNPQYAATIAFDNFYIDVPASIARPTNVVANDCNLSWNAVDDASKYEIYANGKLVTTVTTTSCTFVTDKTGIYDVTVKAVSADGIVSRASDAVSVTYVVPGDDFPIAAAILKLDGSELSWKQVEYAQKYQVLADGKKVWEGTALYCDLSKYVTSLDAVTVTVTAIGGDGYGNSTSDGISYCKSEAVDLSNQLVEGYNVDDILVDTSVHSENSTQSVKVNTKVQEGKARYANVIYYFADTVSLADSVISFDYKEGNDALGGTISIRVVEDGKQIRFDMGSLTFADIDKSMYTVTKLSNGFVRVTFKGEVFKSIGMDEVIDLDFGFSNSDSEGDNYTTEGIIYFDNITVEFPNGLAKSKLSTEDGVLTFTAVDGAEKYEIYVDGKLVKTVTDTSAATYTYSLEKLADGSHTVSVEAISKSSDVNSSTATITYDPAFADGTIDISNASVVARDSSAVMVGTASVSATGGYKNAPVITATLTESDAKSVSDINRFGMKITLSGASFTGGNTIGVYVKTSGYDLSKYKVRLQYKNGSDYVYEDVTATAVSDGWYYCEIEIASSMTAKGTEMYVFVAEKYATGNVSVPFTLQVSAISIK